MKVRIRKRNTHPYYDPGEWYWTLADPAFGEREWICSVAHYTRRRDAVRGAKRFLDRIAGELAEELAKTVKGVICWQPPSQAAYKDMIEDAK